MDLAARVPGQDLVGIRDAQWRTAAVHAAGELKDRGAVLMPELLGAFHERGTVDGTHGFGDAFIGIGSGAVQGLMRALNRERSQWRPYDDELLLPLGTICRQETLPAGVLAEVVQIAVQRLEQSRHAFEALAAIKLIASVPDHADAAIPSLILVLHESSVEVRRTSLNALGAIARRPDIVLPALIRCMDDASNGSVRVHAVRAIGRFDAASSPPVIEALARRAGDESGSVSLAALSVLGQSGPAAAASSRDVISALAHAEASVRASAAKTLPRIQAEARVAVPALMIALKDEDRDVRVNAARSLGAYRAEATPAVDVLIDLLQADPREPVQVSVAEALGHIGPEARRAAPHLMAAWNNNPSAMRESVQRALACIEAKGPAWPESAGEAD
jgi:HEAT repeat protein